MTTTRNRRNRIEEGDELQRTEYVWCKVNSPLAFVLRISRIVGVTALHLTPLHNVYRVCLWPRYAIYSYICLAIFILVSILGYLHDYYVSEPERKIRIVLGLSDIFFTFELLVSNVIVIVAVYDLTNRMKRLIDCMNNIEMINIGLSNNFLNFNVRKSKTIVGSYFLALAAFTVFDIGVAVINTINENLHYIVLVYSVCYYLKIVILRSIQMQLCLVICLLNDSLRLINEQLTDLSLKLKLFNVPEPITATTARTTTRRLFSAYLSICSTVVKLNREEGLIMLLAYIYAVFDLMNTVLIMASTITFSVESICTFLKKDYMSILWLIYQISFLIIWSEPCQRTQDQAILNTVSSLICTPSRVKLPVLFDFFEYQMPKFSPLGVFEFTRSMTVAVFGAMTTFLIIIRQFNIKDKIYLQKPEII